MSAGKRPGLRRVAPTLLMMAGAATAALSASAISASGAAVLPALKLEAARKSVTLFNYDGDVYPDLGIWAVAGARPFEIRAYRLSYAQPISAWLVQPGADTPLPAGSVKDFSGLPGFFKTTYTNKSGKVVASTSAAFCPNDYEPVRRRPDAPATSPYPFDCDANPYSTGAAWGIQSGYGVATDDGSDIKLTVGHTYTATTVIAPKYRAALGISRRDATATVQAKVVKAPDPIDDHRRPSFINRHHASVAVPGVRPSTEASAPKGPLPDLRSLPAWEIGVERGRYLDFSATVWNAGPGRLVVDGFRQGADENLMDAYQYFFDAAGNQIGYAPVGTMEWDPRHGHEHWHFTDFASYRLLDKHKKLVVRSQKEAFCLANTDAVDYTLPGANWHPENTNLHTACGERDSLGVREVLESGSGDTYVQSLPGQSFDLKGLKNGTYYIQVLANPVHRLHEVSTANNASYRKVVISGKAGHRLAKVAKVGVIDEASGRDGGVL